MTTHLPFSTARDLSAWLISYGMAAVYVQPTYKGYKVIHPFPTGDMWHGTKLFWYPKKDQIVDRRTLTTAVRWAASEFDIHSWGKPVGLPRCYFPSPSLEFVQERYPDFRFKKEFNTKKFNDPLGDRYEI